MNRYRSFLGLDKEEESDMAANGMKGKPTTLPSDGVEALSPEMMAAQQLAQAERIKNEQAYGMAGNAEAR